MNKKLVMFFLAGWLLALVIPPTRVTAMFKGSKS